MKQADAIRIAKEFSAEVPTGARERVWRRMGKRRGRLFTNSLLGFGTLAACSIAGFAIVSSFTVPAPRTVFSTDTSVFVATGDVSRGADGALRVDEGTVLVSSWGAPGVLLLALKHRVEAEVAVFSVDVAAQRIALDVREGEVRIDGERVAAGRRWPSGSAKVSDFSSLTLLEPARAAEERAWALAEGALRQGEYPQALERFDALGGGGLRAEAALLQKGELQLRQLSAPGAALSTFDEALERFPAGSLTQEFALSSLEATLALGKWSDARTRANHFLTQFPQSERHFEVRYVSALAAWRLGDKTTTCAEIRGLQPAAFNGERRATLEKLGAQCSLFEH